MSRGYETRMRLRPAMLALRDAEDWARLELRDELLATRIREIHLALSRDVLNGVTYRRTTWEQAQRWIRYATLRGHDPSAGATGHARRLRRRMTA